MRLAMFSCEISKVISKQAADPEVFMYGSGHNLSGCMYGSGHKIAERSLAFFLQHVG